MIQSSYSYNPEINIFWHIYIDSEPEKRKYGRQIVANQFHKLKESGLFEKCHKLYIGYISILPFDFDFLNPNSKIELLYHEKYGHEGLTMMHLKKYCDEFFRTDSHILYFHNRGSSRGPSPACEDWNKMMEYFLIEQWQITSKKLITHHTVGCEMYEIPCRHDSNKMIYHYSGNFWWCNSNYVKMLPYPTFEDRYNQSEMWILQPAGKTIELNKFAVEHHTSETMYDSGIIDIYVDCYSEHYYENSSEIPRYPLDEKDFSFNLWKPLSISKDEKELIKILERREQVLNQDKSKHSTSKGYGIMIELGL